MNRFLLLIVASILGFMGAAFAASVNLSLNITGGPVTFDPANTDTADIALSIGNLHAGSKTCCTSNWGISRGTVGQTSGQYYAEFTVQAGGGDITVGVGVADATQSLAANNFLGGTSHSVGCEISGTVFSNGANIGSCPTATSGQIISMEVDLTAQTVKWRVQGGAWSAPISISGLSGVIYPAMEVYNWNGGSPAQTGDGVTANFGATAYTYVPDTGFINWNGTQIASGGCSNTSLDGTCLGTLAFDWTSTFDGLPVGQRLDWATMHTAFDDPSVVTWWNSNYVYSNNTGCTTYDGNTDGGGGACSPAPTVGMQIVADGKSGNGLQVLADNGLCGYQVNGFGTPQSGINLGPSYNVIAVEWDELWRDHTTAPNGKDFDLHADVYPSGCNGCGKIGILTTFKDPSLPIWYGPQNMFYGCEPEGCGSPATSFNPIILNMGDYGTANPRHTTVETQVGGPAGVWPWQLGTWYHFRIEVALGPNGWYKAWINGVQYDNYPPNPGGINGSGGQSISGGPSTTDAITTTTPTPMATGAGLRGLGIQPHFGGQPNTTTWALGSGDCMRWNSYIVYDNIHVRAYNR